MARSMCVVLNLCLIILAESRVLKPREISLPDGAIVMDIAINQKTIGSEDTSDIAKMKIEIEGEDSKMTLFDIAEVPPGKAVEVTKFEDFVPEIGTRAGIRSKGCPLGYVKRGIACFPA